MRDGKYVEAICALFVHPRPQIGGLARGERSENVFGCFIFKYHVAMQISSTTPLGIDDAHRGELIT